MDAHVDRLNSIRKLEEAGFEGPDADLSTSLFEYGLAWKEEEEEVLFIYGICMRDDTDEYNRFDRTTISASIDPTEEWDWAEWDKVASMIDGPSDYPKDIPLTHVVEDLLRYYGIVNVFGTSYWEGFAIEGN